MDCLVGQWMHVTHHNREDLGSQAQTAGPGYEEVLIRGESRSLGFLGQRRVRVVGSVAEACC